MIWLTSRNRLQNTLKKPSKSSVGVKSALHSVQGKPTSMADLLAATGYQSVSLKRNQQVTGKVVSVSGGEVLVDISAKSEGIITGRELAAASDIVSKLSVGDAIDATVIYPENDAGQVVLSLRKLSADARWKDLEEKRESNEEIEVVALEANRGGVICEWQGIRGFLPASQLSLGGPASQLASAPAKLSDLIGKSLSTRVIEVDRGSNRLILSQKQLDKKDLSQILALLSKIEIGQKLSGVVSAVLPFGVFVEVEIGQSDNQTVRSSGKKKPDSPKTRQPENLDKLEGLVHISEISWEKVEDPAKYFNVGDKVEVTVIAKDEASGRLNLSIKQLAADPFMEISKKYSKDQEVSVTVTRVTPYGVFVTLEGGLEGLVHISKISPNVTYSLGEVLHCTVESVDTRSRRISLVPVVSEKPVLYR